MGFDRSNKYNFSTQVLGDYYTTWSILATDKKNSRQSGTLCVRPFKLWYAPSFEHINYWQLILEQWMNWNFIVGFEGTLKTGQTGLTQSSSMSFFPWQPVSRPRCVTKIPTASLNLKNIANWGNLTSLRDNNFEGRISLKIKSMWTWPEEQFLNMMAIKIWRQSRSLALTIMNAHQYFTGPTMRG